MRKSLASYIGPSAQVLAAFAMLACAGDQTSPRLKVHPGVSANDVPPGAGVWACKVAGPPGKYSFEMDINSTDGGWVWINGPDAIVDFDGVHAACTEMAVPSGGVWLTAAGGSATITMTEYSLPAGSHFVSAQVVNTATGVTDPAVNTIAVQHVYTASVSKADALYFNYTNGGGGPTPPSASCVNIVAVQNVAITPVTLTGTGGSGGPYSFSATGLPAGLTLSSTGTISGTPTVSGTFNYTVTITDNANNVGTVNCSLTVSPPPPAGKTFTIGPSSMEGAIRIDAGDWVNGGYSFKFKSAHTATSFTVTSFVTISGPCRTSSGQLTGTSDVITVPMGTIVYNIPASTQATDWLPTGDANNVLSWEGSIVAPASLCGGGGNQLDASKGAVYTATVSQNPPSGSLVDFRFKYRDPAAKGKPNTNCLDTSDPNRAKADVCGASWSQTVTDP